MQPWSKLVQAAFGIWILAMTAAVLIPTYVTPEPETKEINREDTWVASYEATAHLSTASAACVAYVLL